MKSDTHQIVAMTSDARQTKGGVASNAENWRSPCVRVCMQQQSNNIGAELQLQQVQAGLPLLQLRLSFDQHLHISSSPNGPAI
eukprot:1146643-Pelagomonas_calceolata.AAC.1